MTYKELYSIREEWFNSNVKYAMKHWTKFDYNILKKCLYQFRSGRGSNNSVNDVIIMADTETSKSIAGQNCECYIVAWTISIRAFNRNIVTLYGNKPTELVKCFDFIHSNLPGDDTIVYWHNMQYDWFFIRQFMFQTFGYPVKQLNTKPHYPILLQWDNGIIFKDSLILSQKNLDRWATDLNVEHKKAVGFWDYDKIRNQDHIFTDEELTYIENDTLAGVECIQATMDTLGKKIHTLPYTATGIPREMVRKLAKENNGHERFKRSAPDYDGYMKLTRAYHGGFTHGNRHYIDTTISKENGILYDGEFVQGQDFCSSYLFSLLAFKYPCEKFTPTDNCSLDYIVRNCEQYAYLFKLVAIRPRLKKPDYPMPALQFSKCVESINAVLDNGRILCADYVEIYLSDPDAEIIFEQYDFDFHICTEVECASKDYLPRWFTDYIYECFYQKTMKKGGDPVDYSIAKSKANSLYGLCVMKNIREVINEDFETGEYYTEEHEPEELYDKYVNNYNSVLPYMYGVWCTSYSFRSLFRLGALCEIWIYSDTDSVYGINWNYDALDEYNNNCKELLKKNNYGPVVRDGKEYWLGVAESEGDKDKYSEFRVMGAKRYCGRSYADNELHITVAGVPKKAAAQLKSIDDFTKGFIFKGEQSGKLLHTYYYNGIHYINGNEVADSISLDPCDYLLDSVNVIDWEHIFYDEVEVQVYE